MKTLRHALVAVGLLLLPAMVMAQYRVNPVTTNNPHGASNYIYGIASSVPGGTNTVEVDGGTNQSRYASLASAVAAASGNTRLVVSSTTIVTNNLTIPVNVTLRVNQGGKIVVSNGATLTINGMLDAGEYQVFDFDATKASPAIVLSVNGEWRTSWFLGKSGSTAAKNVKALQIMLDNISNGTVLFDGGYSIDSPLILKTLTSIRGNGKNGKAGLNLANGANTNLIVVTGGYIAARGQIRDMYFWGNRANNTGGSGIVVNGYLQNFEISDNWFLEFPETGIQLDNAGSVLIANNDVHFCNKGIVIDDGTGISLICNNVENTYVVGYDLERVNGFSIDSAYIEGNPVHGTCGTNTQIILRNCKAGGVRNSSFVNYGAYGVRVLDKCENIEIAWNRYYWAHGTFADISFDSASATKVHDNWNYNANPIHLQQGDYKFQRIDNNVSIDKLAKEKFQFPQRSLGYWSVLSNLYDVVSYPGGWTNSDVTETTYGVMNGSYPFPAFAQNELTLTHADAGHVFTNYYTFPLTPTGIPVGRDVVFFGDARQPLAASTKNRYGWAIDGTWNWKTNYEGSLNWEDYPYNRAKRFAEIAYVPAGTTSLEFRLQPAGGWVYFWPGSVEMAVSALMNGDFNLAITNGVPTGWTTNGSPTLTSNRYSMYYSGDYATNGIPALDVSGDTGDSIQQSIPTSPVNWINLGTLMRVGFWVKCSQGAVGVQRLNGNVHELGLHVAPGTSSIAPSATNVWTFVERVMESATGISFVCRSNGTVFSVRDVYAVPVKPELTTHEPIYSIASIRGRSLIGGSSIISDSGSKINGIGFTNNTITVPGDMSVAILLTTNLVGNIARGTNDSGYYLADTNWVLQTVAALGIHIYSAGTTNSGALFDRTNNWQGWSSAPTTATTNSITGIVSGAYVRHMVSTQTFTRVESGPVSVTAYWWVTGTGSPATVTLHPEFYLYDTVSNTLFHEFTQGTSAVISQTAPTLLPAWSITATTITHTNPFKLVISWKIDSAPAAGRTLNFVAGGQYDAHATFVQNVGSATVAEAATLTNPNTTSWGGPTNTITVGYPWIDYSTYLVVSDCSITGIVGVTSGKAMRCSLLWTNATTSNCTVNLPAEIIPFGGLSTNSFTITNGGKMFASSWLVNGSTNVGGSYAK